MRTYWENEGEPDANGEYAATIDLEDGSPISRYKGKSTKEVADALLKAQGNAAVRIKELKVKEVPDAPKKRAKATPRTLSAADRMRIAQDITNPATAPEAIRTVVEAEIGRPLASIASSANESQDEEAAREAAEETRAFLRENPGFYVCAHNNQVLMDYCQMSVGAPTRKNFRIGYEHLRDNGLLIERPEAKPEGELPSQPDTTAASTPQTGDRVRPRMAATGLRNNDTSSNRPTPTVKAGKWTKEQILSMSGDQYRSLINGDPEFGPYVDKLFADEYAATNGQRR